MKRNVLNWINKCEGWKTAIKSLHWASNSLPQHELCDKIADRIAEFQDQVAEVEQSISGTLPLNKLKGTEYKVKDLRTFVQDVLDETNTFYKGLKNDNYSGMRSDCESFLSDMQRFLYLVDFTLKEELMRNLREAMYKNVGEGDDFEVDKFNGRIPKTMKSRINRIYSLVNKYGIGSRLYRDDHWKAVGDYVKVISSMGCEVNVKPCANLDWADSAHSDGGYTDHDESDGMPRSKQYHITITFEDGMCIKGYIKCMAAGTIEDPFSAYDTCMVLWPSNGRGLSVEGKTIEVTREQITEMVNKALSLLSEGVTYGETKREFKQAMMELETLDKLSSFYYEVVERDSTIKQLLNDGNGNTLERVCVKYTRLKMLAQEMEKSLGVEVFSKCEMYAKPLLDELIDDLGAYITVVCNNKRKLLAATNNNDEIYFNKDVLKLTVDKLYSLVNVVNNAIGMLSKNNTRQRSGVRVNNPNNERGYRPRRQGSGRTEQRPTKPSAPNFERPRVGVGTRDANGKRPRIPAGMVGTARPTRAESVIRDVVSRILNEIKNGRRL